MTDTRTYEHLDNALGDTTIPIGNYEVIRHIAEAIGIASYLVQGSSTIRAERAQGAPDLLIRYGYTEGFSSKDEARKAAPGCNVWPTKTEGRWYIDHPINKLRSTNSPRPVLANPETCMVCYMEKSSSGTCDCD